MKTIQNESQNEDLRTVVERIVQDLENSHTYKGKLVIERVEPPPNASTNTPAGYPHLMVEVEERTKLLGLIPHDRKKTILIVKEGFYDIEDKGRKDMFVFLKSKSCEAVARKHFEEYGTRNQAAEIVYKS
jgi:hypothetical protein